MLQQEKEEMLKEFLSHPGLRLFLEEIDARIEVMKGQVLSVSLDKDPEKASLTLYMERMKLEGALALRAALTQKIKAIREKP